MNITLALPIQTQIGTAIFIGIIFIFGLIYFGGRFFQKENLDFLKAIEREFPGCEIIKIDDTHEARILFQGQPLIVTQISGQLHWETYEPDAMEAVTD